MVLPSLSEKPEKPRLPGLSVEAVAIGCSAGGLDALRIVLGVLPTDFSAAVIIVAHTAPDGKHLLPAVLSNICQLPISEARERELVLPGHVYVAPPNYHLLIEPDRSFALSVDERVCFVRPSINVLFQSAADVYGKHLLGVILTGANSDGALGLQAIKAAGGFTLVQDPSTAYADTMPKAAIAMGNVDEVLPLDVLAQEIRRYG